MIDIKNLKNIIEKNITSDITYYLIESKSTETIYIYFYKNKLLERLRISKHPSKISNCKNCIIGENAKVYNKIDRTIKNSIMNLSIRATLCTIDSISKKENNETSI